MKVLITGANSFVGKNLIKQLKKKKKVKIIGCDLKSNKKLNIIKTNIKNKNFYNKIKKKIDIIIHLAAISRDQDCEKDLSDCYNTNVVGSLNVMHAAEKLSAKKIIFASTEWVYHNKLARNRADENSILDISKLKSNYAKSKLLTEYHLKDFFQKKKIDTIILRFGIIYGERKNNWCALEALFNSVKKNNNINVGSLKTSRKFIHVDDICSGIIKSFKLKKFNIINLQGKKLISLKQIIQMANKILNKDIGVIQTNPSYPSIRNIKSKNSYKIFFKPQIDLENGLKRLKRFFNY
tara:strand:+ start:2780 stop:3661 length:882 start_codon:yes stop_codon:yes gene_type:complete